MRAALAGVPRGMQIGGKRQSSGTDRGRPVPPGLSTACAALMGTGHRALTKARTARISSSAIKDRKVQGRGGGGKVPFAHCREKLLVGVQPAGSGLVQRRCAAGPVRACHAPKRLALKEAAVAGGTARRIDLLAMHNQCGVARVGEAAWPTSCRPHVSRKNEGDSDPEHRENCRPGDDSTIPHVPYWAGNTRMSAIMPLSSWPRRWQW